MKKVLFISFILFSFGLFSSRPSFAREKVAARSASLAIGDQTLTAPTETYYAKRVAIQNILRRNDSQLVDYADAFVDSAYRYNIDPYLLVSISGLESYFGKFMVPGTHNGYGWGGGYIAFDNWPDGIETISKALRERYYDSGAETLDDVGRIYAESPTWSVRVGHFMNQFALEEERVNQIVTVL